MDSPIELPDGRLVCGQHGLVVCGRCTVDYSFMDDVLGEAESSDGDDEFVSLEESERAKAILRSKLTGSAEPITRHIFATQFHNDVPPAELFPAAVNRRTTPAAPRFLRRGDARQCLVYTDGACPDNGQSDSKAGWAFVFGPEMERRPGFAAGRLENKGPDDSRQPQTSNRAELRAALGALKFRAWHGEGIQTLVLASDSEYLVKGATEWIRSWTNNGWKTNRGVPVLNRDLWKALQTRIDQMQSEHLTIKFWKIPRKFNKVADKAAKAAARDLEDVEEYIPTFGISV